MAAKKTSTYTPSNGAVALLKVLAGFPEWWKGEDYTNVFALTQLIANELSGVKLQEDYDLAKDTRFSPVEWADRSSGVTVKMTEAVTGGIKSFIKGNLRVGRLPLSRHAVELALQTDLLPKKLDADAKIHDMTFTAGAAKLAYSVGTSMGWTADADAAGCVALARELDTAKGIPGDDLSNKAAEAEATIQLSEGARTALKACVKRYFEEALLAPTIHAMALGKELGIMS